jgi:hypothetical protein
MSDVEHRPEGKQEFTLSMEVKIYQLKAQLQTNGGTLDSD